MTRVWWHYIELFWKCRRYTKTNFGFSTQKRNPRRTGAVVYVWRLSQYMLLVKILYHAPGGTCTCIHWTIEAVVGVDGEKGGRKKTRKSKRYYFSTFVFTTQHAFARENVLILLFIYIYIQICLISYPYDGVEFGHSHLFSSFDRRGHLLLMLYKQYRKKTCLNAYVVTIEGALRVVHAAHVRTQQQERKTR